MTLRLTIERLAPTGEGVARHDGLAVFVDGALPGEEVEAEVTERRRRFWRARTRDVLRASADRRGTDDHERRCGGTDWSHFELPAARRAKAELFRETMRRIGKLPDETFGALSVAESPLGYRLRNQFHFARREGRVTGGFYERRSARIVGLDGCAIVSAPARARVEAWCGAFGDALAEGEEVTVRTAEAIETGPSFAIAARSEPDVGGVIDAPDSVPIEMAGERFHVSAGAFFQVNRFRAEALWRWVRNGAARCGGERALDAFAGGGFFSLALLREGYAVDAVEASAESANDATENAKTWAFPPGLWSYHRAPLSAFLRQGRERGYDVIVADPPRGGLGPIAEGLASLCRSTMIYVSCEPSSLARDLARILPMGFGIEETVLEDFFPLTHRVEAAVRLVRR